jgi:hypothetical protein
MSHLRICSTSQKKINIKKRLVVIITTTSQRERAEVAEVEEEAGEETSMPIIIEAVPAISPTSSTDANCEM